MNSFNRSKIAKKAWSLFKFHKGDWSFGECMKEAWKQAKMMNSIDLSSKRYLSLVKLIKSAPYEAIEESVIEKFIETGMGFTNWSALIDYSKGSVVISDFSNDFIIKLGQKSGKQYGLCVSASFFS